MFFALAGSFFTTEPPGKPESQIPNNTKDYRSPSSKIQDFKKYDLFYYDLFQISKEQCNEDQCTHYPVLT